MQITLLYFAAIRDLTGRSQEAIELPAEVRTVAQLRALLELERPALRGRLGQVRFARNEAFSSDDEVLVSGDEVALIPPVSGG